MPNKCSVGKCKFNYATAGDYVSTFSFPNDPIKHKMWIGALPNIINESRICSLHWPIDVPLEKVPRSRFKVNIFLFTATKFFVSENLQ